MQKGVVIGGSVGNILVRQKSEARLEVGEIVTIEIDSGKMLAQVVEIDFGSSLSQQTIEMISGIQLEEETDLEIADPSLRYYRLARLKPLLIAGTGAVSSVKSLPPVFSTVRDVKVDDLTFIRPPEQPLLLGYLRSGSHALDVPIFCNGTDLLCHHVLITATTGRGKSNLTSCLLWELADQEYGGVLVLDPHDEYFGRSKPGLKDHPAVGSKIVYYTPAQVPAGQRTLRINIAQLRPGHLEGCFPWSDAQREAIAAYYKMYREKWVEALLTDLPVQGFLEGTLGVVKRRLRQLLDIHVADGVLVCDGVFDSLGGITTIKDIVGDLESGKIVVVDTSSFSSATEILIGSILAGEVFSRYRHLKLKGELASKPVISIVLEEAPRVLGKQVLEDGPNVFSSIAREGRKFKVGLLAITQLPSMIPRDILANINTKIILGLEMKPERMAVIESAAQDLSEDDKHIAALDVGEALVTSHLLKFAMPLKIPKFEDLVRQSKQRIPVKKEVKVDFSGMGIG